MPARLENEMRINDITDKILEDMPDYVNEWHDNLYASKKTAATRREFVRKVRNFLSWIDEDVKNIGVEQITDKNVTKYYISIGTKKNSDGSISETSGSYQQGIYCVLKNFLGFLHKKGYIKENYILNIDKPKNNDLERINEHRLRLTKDEFDKVIKQVETEDKVYLKRRDLAMMKVFMGTGMRETALKIINISDVDFEKKTLTTIDKGKGGKLQVYRLNKGMEQAIKEWLAIREDDNEALFINYKGERISCNGIAKVVNKYFSKALGTHVSPHKIRGGVVSILYEQTHDIERVRRSIGHSNSETTQRYIRTANDERDKMAEMLEV